MILILSFLLALTAWILQGAYLPKLAVIAFLPFISLAVMKSNLQRALWFSALSGMLVDLSSDDPIGVHALNYVCVAALFWRIRRHFSPDQPLHLSIFTALASFISTLLQLMLLFLFDRRVPFHGKWILADLAGMPLIDALYAFVWFSSPLALYTFLRHKWMVFWLKRKNPSPTSP